MIGTDDNMVFTVSLEPDNDNVLSSVFCNSSVFVLVKQWDYAVQSQKFWPMALHPRVGRRVGFCNKLQGRRSWGWGSWPPENM